jgi:hypothetical protein
MNSFSHDQLTAMQQLMSKELESRHVKMEQVELLPFKIGGRTYLRPGSSVAGGAPIWASGDLWESKKGQKGDWAGALQNDGSINKEAEEPTESEISAMHISASVAAPTAVAATAAESSPAAVATSFTKQYALVEERKGDFERVIMTKMAEGWELQGGVSFLPSGRYLQAMHRDIRKRNNLGGSSGGRRKLTRKLRRY